MRRKTAIVLGACAALVLAGSAGAAALTYSSDEGRPVGTWQEPDISRTPVAAVEKARGAGPAGVSHAPGTASSGPVASGAVSSGAVSPGAGSQGAGSSASGSSGETSAAGTGTPEAAGRRVLPESATVSSDGRQRVGSLLRVDRLLGYLGAGPRTETFSYPGASYVKLHFDRMAMLPGDYLTVSNPSGTESYRYDAPRAGAERAGRWAMSITGDTAVLKMHRAAGDALGLDRLLGRRGVEIDQVAKGFTRRQLAEQPENQLVAPNRTGKEESVCGSDTSKDAVCYKSADPVAYTKSKAIARLLINGTELCTGWRVGPENRMLTNNHCFTSSSEAYDTEVWFNYQCAQCGGYEVFEPTKVWGGSVLATDHTYDYTLFTVANFADVQKFGYLTLDTRRPAKGQELYVPQHPAGEPTRIAGALGDKAGNCSVADPDYTGYATGSDVSYYCDTEGGSSGSPVLSRRTNRVVALHHFGGCPNSGVRADLLATKLAKYL